MVPRAKPQAVVLSAHKVPLVGSVTLVDPVVVRVSEFAPDVVNAPANDTVFPAGRVRVPVLAVIVFPLKVLAVTPPARVKLPPEFSALLLL